MVYGILAGITWALETVVLGIALSHFSAFSFTRILFLASFIATFLHDLCSALWMCAYNSARKNLKEVFGALKTKGGRLIMLAAVIGGPVGMTGYVMTVNYMGASIGAVASAVFPAIGTVLAYFFLKEKMQWYRWILLIITLLGVYGLSYSPSLDIKNFWLGITGALMCSFGWGIEAVILAKAFKETEIKKECALQIRQSTSALVYGIIILPVLRGWGITIELAKAGAWRIFLTIAIAALFASLSYLCYYRAIAKIGASKAMALDITYVAWAIVFTVIILRDTSVLTPITIICALIVIICGIFAATDFSELKRKQ